MSEKKFKPKDDPGKVVDFFVKDGVMWVKVDFKLSGITYFGRKLEVSHEA